MPGLLAAAVCTRGGKAIVSRQFVEMTKSRIEGLLAAFPKLMSTGKQHTFVETESVRYVYQPLDALYVVLITTKASNILEDLETLRLFAKVVPEYCDSLEEASVADSVFQLIFAFDEIVALGYRESVNLAQVRTLVEMDSHEEKVYRAVRETQEREAKTRMKEKAKEFARKRYEENKRGGSKSGGYSGSSGGYGSSTSLGSTASSTVSADSAVVVPQRSYEAPRPASGKAMKLGSKARDVDSFVASLQSEGETVSLAPVDDRRQESEARSPVHICAVEELVVRAGPDGSLHSLEVKGILKLRIQSPEEGFIRVQIDNAERREVQMQTHPKVDRELWRGCSQIGMKESDKPFPCGTDVAVIRWRYVTSQDEHLPLTVNIWPSEDGAGSCDVNIEYTLEDAALELRDVVITVPLTPGAPPPSVGSCDGSYHHDKAHSALVWSIPMLDRSCSSGKLDFVAKGSSDTFLPVKVAFVSDRTFCDIKVGAVVGVQDNEPKKYSIETQLRTASYTIDYRNNP